jgi:hypothetical protein
MKSLDASLKAIDDFFESEEGQAWVAKKKLEIEISQARLERLDKYLSSLSDEQLTQFIDKLIAKHDDDYKEKIWKRFVEPHPNHLMTLLFDTAFEHATEEVEPIDEFAKIFSSATVKYRGYYFCNVHGQGTVSRIFSPQKLLIFQL